MPKRRLEDTYTSLWRYYESLEGCSLDYAPPKMAAEMNAVACVLYRM
jgi:hypothetical protein